jgi:tetratricopeptide (TPR) repeat protein
MSYRSFGLLWLSLCLGAVALAGENHSNRGTPPGSLLPLTTRSSDARKLFDKGMAEFELVHFPEALTLWRAATAKDPACALCNLFTAYVTPDPSEEASALASANLHAAHASRGEQLLIQWVIAARDGNYVPAISAMNDLLELYPQDKRINFLAGRWLLMQQRYDQSRLLLEKSVALDPNYAAAINVLAYAYAESGDSGQAIAMIERYVALQPGEANPHDSYGEILRMSGHYAAALDQYRQAVRLDPQFGSTLGVADTLALMGKEAEARNEYEKALLFARDDTTRIQLQMQSAITYLREDMFSLSSHDLRRVIRQAHDAGLARQEAECHRILAMYELDLTRALEHLDDAEKALSDRHPIAPADRDEEYALILYTRAQRAATARPEVADKAARLLEGRAQNSRSPVVQHAYHGAAGAVLAARSDYAAAIPHLEEDDSNPISMQLLWQAYTETGRLSDAERISSRLEGWNEVSVEQALIVPHFREMAQNTRH